MQIHIKTWPANELDNATKNMLSHSISKSLYCKTNHPNPTVHTPHIAIDVAEAEAATANAKRFLALLGYGYNDLLVLYAACLVKANTNGKWLSNHLYSSRIQFVFF